MVTCILVIAVLVCGFGWLNQKVVNRALIKWISDRFAALPGKEIRDDLRWTWKHILHIK